MRSNVVENKRRFLGKYLETKELGEQNNFFSGEQNSAKKPIFLMNIREQK